MDRQQEFWETLRAKYEEKNRTLQQREQDLRLKLEAMETIVGLDKPLPDKQGYTCTCHQAQERAGFFKCLFSMFSSNKAKPEGPCPPSTPSPPPPAPQDVPTKEVIQPKSLKNENCMCNPCVADNPQKTNSDSRSSEVCSCSICSRSQGSRRSNADECNCSICSQKNIEELLCNCILEEANKISPPPVNVVPSSCLSPSKVSLKSIDLYYMKNIHDLASQQKDLLNQINKLEQKNKVYADVFNEYKNVDFSKKDKCVCNEQAGMDPNEKIIAELKLENFLLKSELKDMRLEVRQYLERMEGPMQFKIESERYKCLQLEQKLEEAAKEMANLQEFYQKEINTLKMDLCTANNNVYNLTALSDQLKKDLEDSKSKISKLEDDLIRQKISEADTIRSLQAALNAQANANVAKDECNLHQIARELSKVLKECEPCGDCVTLPEDLTTAAQMLKSLADLVDRKLDPDDLGLTTYKEPVKKEPKSMQSKEREIEVMNLEVVQESAVSQGHQQLNLSVGATAVEPQKTAPPVTIENEPQVQPTEQTSEEEAKTTSSEPTNQPSPSEAPPSSSVPASSSAPAVQPSKSNPCKCVKSTKVDQLWPTSGEPVEFKDSGPLDAPKKSKCACSVSKKIKEERGKSPKGSKSCKRKEEGEKPKSRKSDCRPPQPVPPPEPSSLDERCTCLLPKQKEKIEEPKEVVEKAEDVEQVRPKGSERLKLSHQVTADKSKDLLKSATSVKCLKVKENFPFDVDTQVDVINKAPDGVHVTTTITNSGTLEVITEGPEGVIETTLVYTNSGNVEVVTEILEYEGKGVLCKKKKTACKDDVKAIEGPGEKAIEMKTSTSEPGKTPEAGSATNIEATKSGPAVTSTPYSCPCKSCPVEEIQKKLEKGELDAPTGEAAPEVQEDVAAEVAPESKPAEVASEEAKPEEASPVEEAPPVVEEPNAEAAPQDVVEVAATAETVQPEVARALSFSMHVESETNFPAPTEGEKPDEG